MTVALVLQLPVFSGICLYLSTNVTQNYLHLRHMLSQPVAPLVVVMVLGGGLM